MEVVELSTEYGGRTLTLQTGKIAKQTDASVLVTYGETVVLVTVVSSRELKPGMGFFPLTVDFQEKYYAAGRFPGGFFKREAKPSDKATLSARMTDRPIRPLFPSDYMYETHIVATVLSVDGVNDYDFLAQIGASAALHMSDIPWDGPIATCRIGMKDEEFVLNPPPEELEESKMDLLVAGVKDGVVMVEGKALEVTEAQLADAIFFAHEKMKPIMELQEELRKKTGSKEKRDYTKAEEDTALRKELAEFLPKPMGEALAVREKLQRYEAIGKLKKEAKEKFGVAEPTNKEEELKNKNLSAYFDDFKSEFARKLTLDSKKRIDGRDYSDIRNIDCEVGLLPRVHGSSLFTRGETQALATVTLGTSDDEQKIDSISGQFQKPFMLHYNFPPYSVGEARPLRPPGRREVGHGFLAERALEYAIPSKEDFPYSIRIVSEVMESNGSSSMASVCSGCLAMMDAGVPIKKPVAGVAMGLMLEGEQVAILSDILGDEDHLGDMDFKVCGTDEGITAFQMDLKIGGVSREIMEKALEQAKAGRLHILGKMQESMQKPREELSNYAPRIHTIHIKPEKVREVIGPGGKVIRGIIEATGVKIDIEDDGSVNVASADGESLKKATAMIEAICEEPEAGKIYEGKVTRIVDFGAFIEIIPGTEGLCHISELENRRVNRVEDVLSEGEVVRVKCLEVDNRGKIRLSRRALLDEEGEAEEEDGEQEDSREAKSSETRDDEEVFEAEFDGEEDFEEIEEERNDRKRRGVEASTVFEDEEDPDSESENFGNRAPAEESGNRWGGRERSQGRSAGGRGGRGGGRDRGGRDRGGRDRGGRGRGGDDRGFSSRGGNDRDRGSRGGDRDRGRGGEDRGNRFGRDRDGSGGGRDGNRSGNRSPRYGRGDGGGRDSGGRGYGGGGRDSGSRDSGRGYGGNRGGRDSGGRGGYGRGRDTGTSGRSRSARGGSDRGGRRGGGNR